MKMPAIIAELKTVTQIIAVIAKYAHLFLCPLATEDSTK
jgi:hypothetical protein